MAHKKYLLAEIKMQWLVMMCGFFFFLILFQKKIKKKTIWTRGYIPFWLLISYTPEIIQ